VLRERTPLAGLAEVLFVLGKTVKYLNATILIFLSIVAVACDTASLSTATAIPAATEASMASTIPNSTDTPKVVSANSQTNEGTPTIPPGTLSAVSTIEAIVTEKPELQRFYERSCIVSGLCCCVSKLGLSPTGKWAVFFNTIDGTAGLSVVNVDSKKQWDISYYDITGHYGSDATVAIEHWSHDGRYLYVSPQIAGSGGLFWFWRDYIQLIRMNLEDGTWVDTKMGPAFSFSPDDRLIVYRREQNVVIHELQTGQDRMFTVPSEYGAFGRFVWSQDSKQLVFIGSSVAELESDELSNQANGFTLFLLDTGSMKAQVIIENDERYLYPLEWQAPNIVLFERLYRVASDGSLHYDGIEKYKLDLESKDISKFESP
jgi:hypothetical protein